MHQAPGEAVQKVCPRCSTLAYTGDRRCPWCGASYRRRAWPALFVLLLVQTALVLGGVAAMFVIAGNEVDRKLDDEISQVQRDLDDSFDEVERSVRQELDRRLPTQ
jgi:RNA polymerase subunit RPABC4/transcription elongation factor Spt4